MSNYYDRVKAARLQAHKTELEYRNQCCRFLLDLIKEFSNDTCMEVERFTDKCEHAELQGEPAPPKPRFLYTRPEFDDDDGGVWCDVRLSFPQAEEPRNGQTRVIQPAGWLAITLKVWEYADKYILKTQWKTYTLEESQPLTAVLDELTSNIIKHCVDSLDRKRQEVIEEWIDDGIKDS